MNVSTREVILIYLCLLLCGIAIRYYLQQKECIEWAKEQHETITKQKKYIETQRKLTEAQDEKIAIQQELIEAQENLIKLLRIRSIDKLVRCKECKYWWETTGANYGDCEHFALDTIADDFCSYGERRVSDGR